MNTSLQTRPSAAAKDALFLPYYHVRRLLNGNYAVAHWVAGTNTAHADAECLSLRGAMQLRDEMEAQRRAAAA